jgi:hypothetical protein
MVTYGLNNRSRMSREVHVRLCVQRRLACPVGVSPTEVKVRSLVVCYIFVVNR